MSRSFRELATGALILAAGVAGCAHCDTCDDFPVPCTGPGCGTTPAGYGMMPPGGGQIAPFQATPGGSPEAGTMALPSVPNLPSESRTTPQPTIPVPPTPKP